MTNAAEPLSNMITSNQIFPKKFYLKSIKLMINLMEIILSDQSLILDYISTLRKMMIIPKKLTDVTFCKDLEQKAYLLSFMKLNLIMLRDMFETSSKKTITDPKFIKEYPDFIRSTLVKYKIINKF